MVHSRVFRLVILVGIHVGLVATSQARAQPSSVDETLFNVRLIRTSTSTLDPSLVTDFCRNAPWTLAYEDTFDVYSYRTRASDGLVVNTKANQIGTARICYGVFNMSTLSVTTRYRYDLGGEVLEGFGSCHLQAGGPLHPLDLPSAATVFVCSALLSGDGIVGAQTVTTAVNGKDKLEANDPNPWGFHETAFITFRVWR